MSFNQDKKEIESRVTDLYDLASDKLNLKLKYPKITYDLKGSVAGQAWYVDNKLRLNATALKNYRDDYIKQTVGHEVAHLIAFCKHGAVIKPHGFEWKNVMRLFKLPPNRCHTYDLPSARSSGSKKPYVCEGCSKEYKIGPIKHNRWLRGEQTFRCPRCQGKVVWTKMTKEKKEKGLMDLIEF
jgi:SprT protein